MVIYSVIHKRVFTPPRALTTWIIEAIDHSSNSTMAFTKKITSRIFCKCKCQSEDPGEVWKLFCELPQNKLPKALLFITKDLNSANVFVKTLLKDFFIWYFYLMLAKREQKCLKKTLDCWQQIYFFKFIYSFIYFFWTFWSKFQ